MLYSIMCGNVPDVDPDQRLEPASRRADEGWSGESSSSRVLPVYDLAVRGNLSACCCFAAEFVALSRRGHCLPLSSLTTLVALNAAVR